MVTFILLIWGNYNIVEVVENIVQSLAEYMKDNKRNIIFDTIEEEIITACDPDQIERIILNVLSRFFLEFFLNFFCANNLLPFCPCISVTNKSDY